MLYKLNPLLYQDLREILHIDHAILVSYTLEHFSDEVRKLPASLRTSAQTILYQAIYDLLCLRSKSKDVDIIKYLAGKDVTYSASGGMYVQCPSPLYEQLFYGLKSEDFFISLNYDLILDKCVMKRRFLDAGSKYVDGAIITVDYGFSSSYASTSVDLRLIQDNILTIYKPHGSFNWIKGAHGQIEVRPGAKDSFQLGKDGDCEVVAVLPIDKTKVFPSNVIWDAAKKRVKEADELIVLGCSLQSTDLDLMELISIWKAAGHKNVKVVCNSDSNKKYFEELFDGLNLRIHTGGFDKISISHFILEEKQ